VDDHSVPDQTSSVFVKDPGWEQMKCKLLPINDNRMPGIRSALASSNDVVLLRQDIDEFSFSFVTPLASEHDANLILHTKK
jgi:hypothetical protein